MPANSSTPGTASSGIRDTGARSGAAIASAIPTSTMSSVARLSITAQKTPSSDAGAMQARKVPKPSADSSAQRADARSDPVAAAAPAGRREAIATPLIASAIPTSLKPPSGSPEASPAVTGTITPSEPIGVTIDSGPSVAAR